MFNQPLGARYHDVAIMKIEPLTLNEYIRKICLPEKATDSSKRSWDIPAIVAGWGSEIEGGSPTEILMDVHLSIFTLG